MKNLVLFLLFIIIFSILTGCGFYQKPLNHASPVVRVLLDEGTEMRIKPGKNYILSINSRREMGSGMLFISLTNNSIEVNDMVLDIDSIEIYPNQYFEFTGKKYPGFAKIIKNNGSLMLINIVDIETYLHGVLPNEASPEWNIEALKAQAIVSRTFALYEIASSRKSGKSFDLYDDTRSQVYYGLEKSLNQHRLLSTRQWARF